MLEERNSRGRKPSLAIYHEEDVNDLSDLGIGTSSGKSSISGDGRDSHDNTHSILSEEDNETEKNQSDINCTSIGESRKEMKPGCQLITTLSRPLNNSCPKESNNNRGLASAISTTVISSEPEEYTYESAIRGYVSRVSQNITSRNLIPAKEIAAEEQSNNDLNMKSIIEQSVKIDILKRREIFEKASQKPYDSTSNDRANFECVCKKSVKEKLWSLEKQISVDARHSFERGCNKFSSYANPPSMSNYYRANNVSSTSDFQSNNQELHAYVDNITKKEAEKRLPNLNTSVNDLVKEKSSTGTIEKRLSPILIDTKVNACSLGGKNYSPNTEHNASKTIFHRSLDSLETNVPNGPDIFGRVQSLEEIDYGRRYLPSFVPKDPKNDSYEEFGDINPANVNCSVIQTDKLIDEDILQSSISAFNRHQQQDIIPEDSLSKESSICSNSDKFLDERKYLPSDTLKSMQTFPTLRQAILIPELQLREAQLSKDPKIGKYLKMR
ncbi:uncharacterized protein smash isoform X2 [Prorops nasuta]